MTPPGCLDRSANRKVGKNSMARTPSTKTLALKTAASASQPAYTRWQAILTLEGLIPGDELALLLRQLLSGTKKGRVVRLCLEKLAALEQAKSHRAEIDRILAEETARLAKRDPKKTSITPSVQSPGPVIAEAKPSPETGQAIPPKIAVAQSIPAQPIPKPVTAPAQLPGTVPNRRDDRERKPMTATDPRPSWNFPKGAFLDRDEQSRLLELFRTALDSTKTESQRRAARLQLEKVIPTPDAGRSTFAIYLLAMLDWLERHPEQKPTMLPGEQPAVRPNIEYELFSMNFSTQRYFATIAEQERLRKLNQGVKNYVEQGSMWDGLPSMEEKTC